MLAKAFGPGSNGPLLLVADIHGPADAAAVAKLAQTLNGVPGIVAAIPAPVASGAKIALINVIPATAPQDAKTSELIKKLRVDVIPQAVKGTTAKVYVGGVTAIFDDFATVLQSKLPLFIGVIVRARLPAALRRLPQHRRPTHGGGDEPARRRRRLRSHRGGLPVGLAP